MSIQDPATVLDSEDPGDDTQRRFRYQHGYGVILLCGAATSNLDYVAVWCEHHEDLLGEKGNGHFDSFQIKTAKPELGAWKMSSQKLQESIGRFVELDGKFPGKFDAHTFVSNVSCYDTEKAEELGKSPIKLLRAVRDSAGCNNLPPIYAKALNALATECECDKEALFATCKRVRIAKGPPLDSFETSIAHEHLPNLPSCSALKPAELDALRDELIQVVFNASSLAIDDPSKHWCCVLGADHLNPRLLAKRLVAKDIISQALISRSLVFRFAPSTTSLKLGDPNQDLAILAKKLLKGGLANYLDIMQSRTISAEQHLLTLVAEDAGEAHKIINQLKELVLGVCSDAEALASATKEPWGLEMYRRVLTRLQNVTDSQADLVHHQPHECLMGVAGLLTEECKVWWSPKFDIKELL